MKAVVFCIMAMVSLTTLSQNNINYLVLRVYKSAYNILREHYSAGDLCVSDSIYDLDWQYFADKVDDETAKIFRDYRLDKLFIWTPPVHSNEISAMIDSIGAYSANSKYIVEFSSPYKMLVMCRILPIDKRIGILGAPQIPIFLFKFDWKGNILDVNKKELCID